MSNKILVRKCLEYFKKLKKITSCSNHPITLLYNEYDKLHPQATSFELKAAQYEITAENIDTAVFEETPFYFVNNIAPCPGLLSGSCCAWLYVRNRHIYKDASPTIYENYRKQIDLGLFHSGSYCDEVHYTVPIENIVSHGMKKYYDDAEKAKKNASPDELDFLNSAQRGLLAAKRICERYVQTAYKKLETLNSPELRHNMEMLIESASRCPWEAPKTFFEGLNTCWFSRNVLGAMEGVGNSTLGRVDYILYNLYKNDIEDGRLTKEDAYELIKQFVLLGDMQYDKDTTVEGDCDHELEMGIALGGCDIEGKPVFNELTEMFIRAHSEMGCIFPKIHARFSSDSPEEYLELLANEFVNGRSTIGLSCDDGIIPGLIKAGKTLEDARNYETVGCWENKIPNKECMPGANYLYAVKILEETVYGPRKEFVDAGFECIPLEGAKTFDEVYRIIYSNLRTVIRFRCETFGKYGKLSPLVNPMCLTSVMRDGSIEKKRDYTQGGSIYNDNTCDIAGFANIVDALLAIKKLCYDDKYISLKNYLNAVRNNWKDNEELLYKVRHCPHFGDNTKESLDISNRLHSDLYHALDGIESERGGKYFLNYYVYREFFKKVKDLRATPDGRRDGEMYAQGIGPSKYHPADSLSDVIQSVCKLNCDLCGTSALDIQLPFGKTSKEQLSVFLRIFAKLKIKHLQINCVSVNDLTEAQKHPEKHQDLIVRVTGFSAKFVSLSPEFQEEIIKRHIYE